jgi:hypothetical protein
MAAKTEWNLDRAIILNRHEVRMLTISFPEPAILGSGIRARVLPGKITECWWEPFSLPENIQKWWTNRGVNATRKHRIKISNRRATQRCNVSSFFLCKNMQFTGQKAEQPASTACLLARKCHWLARKMAANMRNATCARPFYMDLYSMLVSAHRLRFFSWISFLLRIWLRVNRMYSFIPNF